MDEIEFLKFEDWQEEISRSHLTDVWLPLYYFKRGEKESYATFCGLMSNEMDLIKRVLMSPYWEISPDFGSPGFWREGAEGAIRYERFGRSRDEMFFEPLIICRSFHDLYENSVELSEEFRLYHNLYHDKNKDNFVFIDKTGEEDVAAKIEKINDDFKVCIKTKYLRDFLAAKKMVLVRFHDHMRYSEKNITDVVKCRGRGENFCYEIIITPESESMLNCKAFSRFVAKDILPPLQQPNHPDYQLLAGISTKKYENFIINIDSEGNPVERTCNPTLLSPRDYLTPVFFQREVLKKYYDHPHKYTVGDNYLSCGSLWGMRYGQNPSGLVHVWLGDLGEYLPHTEQLHWKQYNVSPEGGLGLATIKRELLAEPSEPDETTHKFKYEFKGFSEIWAKKFGWHLFLPLENEDMHFMKSLHVPVSEDPLEFDQQILALAKILPDSINVSEIKKAIKVNEEEVKNHFGIKKDYIPSITWLEALFVFFFKENDETAHKITKPIRIIQKLRSASAAHRKGRKYDKISRKLGLDRCSRIEYFKNLLEDVIKTLKKLQEYCESC